MEQLGIAKRFGNQGPVASDLEWDVKSMFALNGGLHDAAIAAWNHKGIYDSSRPISQIRYMGQLGQSSDPGGPSYSSGRTAAGSRVWSKSSRPHRPPPASGMPISPAAKARSRSAVGRAPSTGWRPSMTRPT